MRGGCVTHWPGSHTSQVTLATGPSALAELWQLHVGPGELGPGLRGHAAVCGWALHGMSGWAEPIHPVLGPFSSRGWTGPALRQALGEAAEAGSCPPACVVGHGDTREGHLPLRALCRPWAEQGHPGGPQSRDGGKTLAGGAVTRNQNHVLGPGRSRAARLLPAPPSVSRGNGGARAGSAGSRAASRVWPPFREDGVKGGFP